MNLESTAKQYNSEGGLIYSCQYHVIFTTKYRRKVLINGVDAEFKRICLESQEKLGFKILEMEVMPDHVHLLVESNPKIGIFVQINRIKGLSSNILRNKFPWLKKRIPTLWTRSKFISTVGSVSLEVVKKYIEDQKKV